MAMNTKISSSSSFEHIVGFSRAIVDESYVHVAGTTGYDYQLMTIAESVVEQCHQCFKNITDALCRAGCSLDDVVRVRYYLTDANAFETLGPIFGTYLGGARPATTVLVCGLVDPRMKLEIEVTAQRPVTTAH
jgi:enamine deaminase RidA (YjgF/YER057c/UK114 family)